MDFPPGTLNMLVLKTLVAGPLHGYGIAQRILEASESVLQVEEGSLYPALQRMLINGWVTAEWRPSETGRRARFYQLTGDGRKQLETEIGAFDRSMKAVYRAIEAL